MRSKLDQAENERSAKVRGQMRSLEQKAASLEEQVNTESR